MLGVPEEDIEDTWEKVMVVFNEKLQVEVKKEDIVAAHRISNFRNAKPRVILVKFLRRQMQEKIVRARSKLKGTHRNSRGSV